MSHVARGSLTAPWAVAGAIGAYLYVEGPFPRRWLPWGVAAALLFVTPLCAGVFGHLLTRCARRVGREFAVPLAVATTLAAGLANGIVIGGGVGVFVQSMVFLRSGWDMLEGVAEAAILGATSGVMHAFPFLLPMTATAVFFSARGRARHGTLVDRSDARAVWVPIPPWAAAAAAYVEATASRSSPPTAGVMILAYTCVAASAVMFVLDAIDCHCARRERLRDDDGSSTVLDVGIGDETVVRRVVAETAYRDAERDVHIPRGNPGLAAAMLARRALGTFSAFVATSLFAAFAQHARLDHLRDARSLAATTSLAAHPNASGEAVRANATSTVERG